MSETFSSDKVTTLVPYKVPSIYIVKGKRVDLPRRMAMATPDTALAIATLNRRVAEKGGVLYFSDGYRSSDMQLQAHLDYKASRASGGNRAYSPPPGGSWHEAGRADDIDVKTIHETIEGGYETFWDIAIEIGWHFVIPEPDPNAPEAWHIEFRGPFQELKEKIGYKEACRAAIRDIGGHPDDKYDDDDVQLIQADLLMLGYDVGPVDGIVGKKSRAAAQDFLTFIGPRAEEGDKKRVADRLCTRLEAVTWIRKQRRVKKR